MTPFDASEQEPLATAPGSTPPPPCPQGHSGPGTTSPLIPVPPSAPPPERDASDDPVKLHKVIDALRAHAAWHVDTLAATQAAYEALAQHASDAEDAQHQVHSRANGDKEASEVIDSLRTQLAQAQLERDEAKAQRDEAKAQREEGARTVGDLRLRLEDSRKAFMRLQTESENARKTLSERNRLNQASIGGNGASSLLRGSPPNAPAQALLSPFQAAEDDEAKAKRNSKRASLAFGPNGNINVAASRDFGRMSHSTTHATPRPTTPPSGVGAFERKLRTLSLVGRPPTNTAGASLQPVADRPGPSNPTSPASAGSGIHAHEPGSSSHVRGHHHHTSSNMSGHSSFSSSLRPMSPSTASNASSRGQNPRPPPAPASFVQVTAASETDDAVDAARRRSRMLGTASPTSEATCNAVSTEAAVERLNTQLYTKSSEIDRLQKELQQVREELDQALEARAASDACSRSLREFIALLPSEQAPPGPTASTSTEPVAEGSMSSTKAIPMFSHLFPKTSEVEDAAAATPSRSDQQPQSKLSRLGSMLRRTSSIASRQNGDSNATPDNSKAKNSKTGTPDNSNSKNFTSESPSDTLPSATGTSERKEEAAATDNGLGSDSSPLTLGTSPPDRVLPTLSRTNPSYSALRQPTIIPEEEESRVKNGKMSPTNPTSNT